MYTRSYYANHIMGKHRSQRRRLKYSFFNTLYLRTYEITPHMRRYAYVCVCVCVSMNYAAFALFYLLKNVDLRIIPIHYLGMRNINNDGCLLLLLQKRLRFLFFKKRLLRRSAAFIICSICFARLYVAHIEYISLKLPTKKFDRVSHIIY